MKTDKLIKSIAILVIFVFVFSLFIGNTSAESYSSIDLVILRKAMLNQIEYDADWLDVNSDSKFDITDLIRLKRYYSKEDVEINSIKYIDITYVSGESQTVVRQYHSRCSLPALDSPYLYWKKANSYYNEYSVISLYSNTTFTAVESKKDVDFPIIDF